LNKIEKAAVLDFCRYVDFGVKVKVKGGLWNNPFG
jgi:hypothetical protein